MLLRDDVVADREAEPRPFASRFCREERLEQLVLDVWRDAVAVVPYLDLDRVAEIAGRYRQQRPKRAVTALLRPLVSGIEAVAEQVQEHPSHLLRRQLDLAQVAVIVLLKIDVEALILGAGTVIGEVQSLVEQHVE